MESVFESKSGEEFKKTTGNAKVATADPMQYNVAAIAKLEEQALDARSAAERMSDAITRVTGSMGFVLFHLALFAFWFAANLNFLPSVPAFDPFPFGVLTLIVSTEGVFLAIFILISQNRITRQADRRGNLDLQVNLLAEQELTMILRMLEQMSEHFGIEVESIKAEAHRLTEATDVDRVVDELEEKLPNA